MFITSNKDVLSSLSDPLAASFLSAVSSHATFNSTTISTPARSLASPGVNLRRTHHNFVSNNPAVPGNGGGTVGGRNTNEFAVKIGGWDSPSGTGLPPIMVVGTRADLAASSSQWRMDDCEIAREYQAESTYLVRARTLLSGIKTIYCRGVHQISYAYIYIYIYITYSIYIHATLQS